jgi:hypothetical protein
MRGFVACVCGLSLQSGLAWAQPAPPAVPASGIFACTDEQGRRHTADRPIVDCQTREQRLLNSDGSLRAVLPPSLSADERAEKESRERRSADVKTAQADLVRRDRNLLQRYPNEAAHNKARDASMETARSALRASEQRLAILAAERKPLADEADFYKGRAVPAPLKAQLESNEASVEATRAAATGHQAELGRLGQFYDAELARLKKLWAGAAPGTLGPLTGEPESAPQAPGAAPNPPLKRGR